MALELEGPGGNSDDGGGCAWLSTGMTADVLLMDPQSVRKMARKRIFKGAILTGAGWKIPDDEVARIAKIQKWPDTAEAGRELGLDSSWTAHLCNSGKLQGVKLLNRWHVDPESVERLKGKTHVQRTHIRYDILEDKDRLAKLVGRLGMKESAKECRCTPPTVRKYLRIHNLKKVTKQEFGEALVRAYKRVGVEPEGCPPYCPETCLKDGVCVFEG